MLQPRKKLTRKEIRRDPLLESIDKGRIYYAENKRTINGALVALAAIILLGWGWQHNREQTRQEAQLASTKAVAAYIQGASTGVEEELQTVADQYKGNDGTALSVYYLGVTKLDSNQYDAATALFQELVKNTDSKILKADGYLKLAYVQELQNNYPEAAKLYEKAAKTGQYTAKEEALIAAGYNYQRAGNLDAARRMAQEVDKEKLSSELLDSYQFLQGMIGS